MSGLIIKDFLNLKKQMLPIAFFFVVYFVISIMSGDTRFFSGIIMMFCAILPITALAYDDRAGWNKYALTMPVSRQMLVVSKYLMTLILMAMGGIIMLLFNIFLGTYKLYESILSTSSMMLVGIMILGISLPLNYRFGIEKARYVLIGVCVMPAVLVSVLSVGVANEGSDEVYGMIDLLEIILTSDWIVFVELLLSTAIFVISMFVSVRIVLKKEF